MYACMFNTQLAFSPLTQSTAPNQGVVTPTFTPGLLILIKAIQSNPTGQSDLDNASLRLSSRVFLGYVQLTI